MDEAKRSLIFYKKYGIKDLIEKKEMMMAKTAISDLDYMNQ